MKCKLGCLSLLSRKAKFFRVGTFYGILPKYQNLLEKIQLYVWYQYLDTEMKCLKPKCDNHEIFLGIYMFCTSFVQNPGFKSMSFFFSNEKTEYRNINNVFYLNIWSRYIEIKWEFLKICTCFHWYMYLRIWKWK